MQIKEFHRDVQCTVTNTTMRIYFFHPSIPNYPHAKFPGVVMFSEIYQVTGPVARFARLLAGHGYIVACPSSFHEFTDHNAMNYDAADTDRGNEFKVTKKVEAYDEDAKLAVDELLKLKTCTGKIGATGMCLGGHLAYRAAFDPRVTAAVCYFATDIHSHTLGLGKSDNSLQLVGEKKMNHCELAMIFGKLDNHVPPEGRDLIRKTMHEAGVKFGWYEFPWAQHAFIRDESSKGRYDPAVTRVCWGVLEEVFERCLRENLGEWVEGGEIEDVC